MDRSIAALATGLARLLALGFVALLVVPLVWTVATGDRFLEVTGVSMTPTYHRGDLLLVRPPAGDELTRVGQVVVASFGEDDTGPLYVHRVHQLTADGAVLKGDANVESDPRPVTAAQVVGTPRMHLSGAAADAFLASQTLVGRAGLVACAALCGWGAPALVRAAVVPASRSGRRSAAPGVSRSSASPSPRSLK
jgi:signal peptidase